MCNIYYNSLSYSIIYDYEVCLYTQSSRFQPKLQPQCRSGPAVEYGQGHGLAGRIIMIITIIIIIKYTTTTTTTTTTTAAAAATTTTTTNNNNNNNNNNNDNNIV